MRTTLSIRRAIESAISARKNSVKAARRVVRSRPFLLETLEDRALLAHLAIMSPGAVAGYVHLASSHTPYNLSPLGTTPIKSTLAQLQDNNFPFDDSITSSLTYSPSSPADSGISIHLSNFTNFPLGSSGDSNLTTRSGSPDGSNFGFLTVSIVPDGNDRAGDPVNITLTGTYGGVTDGTHSDLYLQQYIYGGSQHTIMSGSPTATHLNPGDTSASATFAAAVGQQFLVSSSLSSNSPSFGKSLSDLDLKMKVSGAGVPSGTGATASSPGDYDGDGKADLGVYDETTHAFAIALSHGGAIIQPFGDPTHQMIPVSGDYDGDGKADLGVYDETTHAFIIALSHGGAIIQPFGDPTHQMIPVSGDYDGDGKADLGVYDETTHAFIIALSHGGAIIQPFGDPTHQMIPTTGSFPPPSPQPPPPSQRPTIALSTLNLSFTTTQGADAPTQTFAISNTGSGILHPLLNYQNQLLVTSQTQGNIIYVTVDPRAANLAPGTYSFTITVSDPNATDSPQVVNATLDVMASIQQFPQTTAFKGTIQDTVVSDFLGPSERSHHLKVGASL